MITHLAGRDAIDLVGDVDGPDNGPTVMLLHGGGQTRHSWAGTWQVLVERGWRAYSMDLRGHGDSAWDSSGDYSHDAYAADVHAMAHALPTPPILVGASLGGIASMLAIAGSDKQSETARGLVLVDVANRIEPTGRDRIGEFMLAHIDGFATLDDAADAIAAYNPHRPRPTDLTGLAKNLRERDGRWFWHWDPAFVNGKFGSADETRTTTMLRGQLDGAADNLRVPTLLVRGRSSDLLSQTGVDDFLARMPHAEFADVAGAGHMVAGDKNEIFNKAILDFLDRHRP